MAFVEINLAEISDEELQKLEEALSLITKLGYKGVSVSLQRDGPCPDYFYDENGHLKRGLGCIKVRCYRGFLYI